MVDSVNCKLRVIRSEDKKSCLGNQASGDCQGYHIGCVQFRVIVDRVLTPFSRVLRLHRQHCPRISASRTSFSCAEAKKAVNPEPVRVANEKTGFAFYCPRALPAK